MCGICGFFGKKKNKREIVEKMKEKLVHRGPDAQGSFVNDSVALGFRRLSIIDLEGGLQPMKSSSQNLTVVFNGEIYNYQELREQMEREKKILFVTRSDTETLVNGLEAYGPAFVEQLRGMFAFAVWNEKKEELMLARDFFGIKPLFYTVVDGNFVFASEIKSILQFPGVPKKLNERALEQYLSFQYSVLEETFFEGIYRLPPGCMLFYRQGKYEICRYFQPKLQPEAGCSLADMEKKLESVLKKSVRRHMVSDVEVGTFLSGGVDSGFIAVSSGAKMAFTVGFLDGNSGYNEENRAREVARYAHLSYHMHTIGKKEFWDVLPKVMYALDEPSGDASAVAMYFLAAKASRYVKVVLSGEGADELFGGYNIYREPLALQKVAWIPEKIRRAVSRQAKKLPDRRGKSFLIRAGQRVEERFIGNAHIFTDEERRELLKNPTDTPSCQEFLRKTYEEAAGLSDPEKMQNIDLKYWLAGDILHEHGPFAGGARALPGPGCVRGCPDTSAGGEICPRKDEVSVSESGPGIHPGGHGRAEKAGISGACPCLAAGRRLVRESKKNVSKSHIPSVFPHGKADGASGGASRGKEGQQPENLDGAGVFVLVSGIF